MAEEIVCKKGRGHVWELVGVEIFFGALTLAMLLVAVLLPLEESVAYIRYIFAGLTVLAAGFLCAVVCAHVKFARLPDCLLKKTDRTTLQDNFNRRQIKIGEIAEVRANYAKNKYGKAYSFGTLTIVTARGICKIKNVGNPAEAKEKIEQWKKELDGRGV